MKKRFLKSKPVCKVTFRLPRKMVKDASHVHLVGEFNHWNILATPMKKLKNGDFTATVDLGLYREYEFRYLHQVYETIDQRCWKKNLSDLGQP